MGFPVFGLGGIGISSARVSGARYEQGAPSAQGTRARSTVVLQTIGGRYRNWGDKGKGMHAGQELIHWGERGLSWGGAGTGGGHREKTRSAGMGGVVGWMGRARVLVHRGFPGRGVRVRLGTGRCRRCGRDQPYSGLTWWCGKKKSLRPISVVQGKGGRSKRARTCSALTRGFMPRWPDFHAHPGTGSLSRKLEHRPIFRVGGVGGDFVYLTFIPYGGGLLSGSDGFRRVSRGPRGSAWKGRHLFSPPSLSPQPLFFPSFGTVPTFAGETWAPGFRLWENRPVASGIFSPRICWGGRFMISGVWPEGHFPLNRVGP